VDRDPTSPPVALVVFGAGGDLAWRKVLPAVYNLFLDQWLPDNFAVVGVDRKPMSDDEFRQHLRQGVDEFSRSGPAKDEAWQTFATRVSFVAADFGDPAAFAALADRLAALDEGWRARACRVFYCATPPALFGLLAGGLGGARLNEPRDLARIVVEKPFGHDLDSARALNQGLISTFDESQIFRIDHYLGKETVQNILAFRFANAVFEPIWDRRYVDHVQITVGEQVGVEHRGGYYEQAGALRDMVQSHLLQVLCLIAMEPPVSFVADEIRNKKLDVLRAIRPIPGNQVARYAVRGQYGSGWIEGQRVPAYRDEPDVARASTTETFAALKLSVDNWRWQDVPFYVRTGKHLPARVSEVSIQFRPVPHQAFPSTASTNWQPNRLAIHIQPDEGIQFRFQAKQPGPAIRLSPVDMLFRYRDVFKAAPPDAYETLLLDVVRGDATLFMRDDQVDEAWSLLMPILNAWGDPTSTDLSIYPAGTWGPETADTLLAQDGRSWLLPTILENHERKHHG